MGSIPRVHQELMAETQIVRSIPSVPITLERKPFINTSPNKGLQHAGTARANIATSNENLTGTTTNNYSRRNSHRTVLQQHCDFFDRDGDGEIWPYDTFIGFHRLGFGLILSFVAVFIIHANFSYPTVPGILPDPYFRLFLDRVHKDKHGSDTGTYDTEGRYIPQRFEDIFSKYADGRDYLTITDVWNVMKGQRCIADPIGWGGAFFEWTATYLMLWPADGKMKKEDIRSVYDGSIFYRIAEERENSNRKKQ